MDMSKDMNIERRDTGHGRFLKSKVLGYKTICLWMCLCVLHIKTWNSYGFTISIKKK